MASEPIKLYVVVDKTLSTTTEPVNPIGFQLQVKAPLPVNVTVPGPHNTVGVADMDTDGAAFTLIVIIVLAKQPNTLFASTVQVVVTLGLTTTVVPVNPPGFHVYVNNPEAVNVALVPSQIVELDEDKLNVGSDTDNDKVVVFVQPDALLPVTV